MMTRLPAPGPSYLREETVFAPGASGEAPHRVLVGMTAPSTTDDGWWLALVFARDDDGIVPASMLQPRSGPPPVPPLHVMGPVFAGALAGMIAEEGGRQQVRLALPPAPDESRPWERPLIARVAIRWDPVRVATMRPNQLAYEVLVAFRRALEAAGRP